MMALRRWLFLFFFLVTGCMLFPSSASAIPAWSRQYSVPCATCHYPAPPRLNTYGHQFRRAQYRNSGEFGKDPDWEKVGNYLAFRIRGRYEYTSTEVADPNETRGDNDTTESSGFRLSDATLFYAGPVTKNFSGFVELERPGDDPEIEAVVSVGGITGSPDSFATFRVGQFHTLTRVGFGGLDRPTGITTPDALSRDLTAGGSGLRLNQDQVGLEGTYVHKKWRVIGQILNGADAESSTTDHFDDNKDKDGLLAYEMIWGDLASGFTVFGYRGTQDDLLPEDPNGFGTAKIHRYGATAAQVWKTGTELQGGFILAKDTLDNPPGASDIKGRGWWVEVEQYFDKLKDLTVFGRYDLTDPDTDEGDNTRTKATIGAVLPVGGWHARWGVELRRVAQDTPDGTLDGNEASAELMLNF